MSDYAANFSQTKKIVNLPGSGFFFHGGKKKKSGIPEKSGGGPSLYHFNSLVTRAARVAGRLKIPYGRRPQDGMDFAPL